ncbi:hypothetical protein OK016_25535 [Vibrio chagasii]|nr:hypothetical protein [Vibrio chagasii]
MIIDFRSEGKLSLRKQVRLWQHVIRQPMMDSFVATTRALVGNTTEPLTLIHSQTQVNTSKPINVTYELAKVGGKLDTANFTLDSVTLPDQGTTGLPGNV